MGVWFIYLQLPINGKEEIPFTVYPLRSGTIQSILLEIQPKIQLDLVNGSGQLRLMDVTGSRITPGIDLDNPLDCKKTNISCNKSKAYLIDKIHCI